MTQDCKCGRRFVVRDISEWYDGPTFDVLFFDHENGVERYSIEMFDNHVDAQAAADAHEARNDRPVEWDEHMPMTT